MPLRVEDFEQVEVRSRAALRDWLEANHSQTASVWLVTCKKHTGHYVPFGDLVEELLCWGWVDSRTLGIDTDRSAVLIAPRNPKSAWSAVNKVHVDRARASGAMTPAGEALIEAAKATGMWAFLDDVERLDVPSDLGEALKAGALTPVWEGWPRSVKRGTLEWIKTAKAAPTRAARIAEVADSAAKGLRPKPFRR